MENELKNSISKKYIASDFSNPRNDGTSDTVGAGSARPVSSISSQGQANPAPTTDSAIKTLTGFKTLLELKIRSRRDAINGVSTYEGEQTSPLQKRKQYKK